MPETPTCVCVLISSTNHVDTVEPHRVTNPWRNFDWKRNDNHSYKIIVNEVKSLSYMCAAMRIIRICAS